MKSKVSYKTGTLSLSDMQGSIESTRFQGSLGINLLESQIVGEIFLPFFRMTDIQQAISQKLDLQNRFLGSGSGKVTINTPFEVDKMGFTAEARLFRGQAFGEEFNEAKINAKAVDGTIRIDEFLLEKEKTKFSLSGQTTTKLESDLAFRVDNGFLQQLSLVRKFRLPASGEFVGHGKITGNLANPHIKTQATLNNLVFNKTKYGAGALEFSGQILGGSEVELSLDETLKMTASLPSEPEEGISCNSSFNNLNIAPIVEHFVSQGLTGNYAINTTGYLAGTLKEGRFWDSEFSALFKNFDLKYKSNKLVLDLPASLELKNQSLQLSKILLRGGPQYLQIVQSKSARSSASFTIDSEINIALFKIFAPFLEKIDGLSKIHLEATINQSGYRLIGSSYTKDGFLKFPGFPHPVQDLKADVLFNQNQLLINSLNGKIAEGKIVGDGRILFPEPGRFDLQINTEFDKVQVNFPEDYNTTGSGSVSLSGTKAPFLLKGIYNVSGGLVESNFSSGASSSNSDLLEDLLKKEVSSPLLLDMKIVTQNPVEIRNSFVEGYILGNVVVFDKINAPRIRGEAHFDDNSVVKFKDQEFEISSSSFLFEGQSPVNPKLNLRSKTRFNSYDIDLFLQGRALNPQLTMTSQPPLPGTQIISMLAFGQLPASFESGTNNINNNLNNNNNNEEQNSNIEVGTALLGSNPLAKEIKEQSGFDVQISSSFDEQTGAAAPRLTLRNQINKKLEVSASSTTGNSNQYEGRLTYELNNELSTIFRITSPDNTGTTLNGANNTTTRRNNPFGVDLEYNVEFD